MPGQAIYQSHKLKIIYGGNKIKKGMLAGNVIYSSGNIVTYYVDSGVSYQEEVGDGESVLSPKTFTPTKAGWEFVGWRVDSTANETVLTSKIMEDTPVTLYAVFRQLVTVTYYTTSNTANQLWKYKYYNNGNIANPTFTLNIPTISGWIAYCWVDPGGRLLYQNGVEVTIDSNVITYAQYIGDVTLTLYNGSTTATSETKKRYYIPSTDWSSYPSFTLTQVALSGWTPRGWSPQTAGNGRIDYGNGLTAEIDSSVTLYGMYYQTITLSYVGNGATGGSTAAQTGTRYYNSIGNVVNPTFTLASNGFTRTSYTFIDWYNGSTHYDAGSTITLITSLSLYAYWFITSTLYEPSASVQTFTAPRTGTYGLQLYGAAGGSVYAVSATAKAWGGYGSRVIGDVFLTKGQVLYMIVPGASGAEPNGYISGVGSNGGAGLYANNNAIAGAGGGATHVATVNRGALENYIGHINELLMVAAGGGGGFSVYLSSDNWAALSGGAEGESGGSLNNAAGSNAVGGAAATASSGFTFGKGGGATSSGFGGAGGGGLYGGYAGSGYGGGGGGSSYINASAVSNGTTQRSVWYGGGVIYVNIK